MNVELMKALEQIEEEKGISKEVIIEAIEAALLSAYKKNYGASAQSMRIEVVRTTGEMRAFQIRTVVESVEDEATQIALDEVRQWDPTAQLGEMVEIEVTPRDFGRIAAVLPPTEQIPRESYRQSERIKAYVVEVRQGTRGPQIVVSRTHPGLLKRLFELEVPEIYEGVVEIK